MDSLFDFSKSSVLVLAMLLLAGCLNAPSLEGVKANFDVEFSLKVNQTALIESDGLQITFLSVEDSRCPIDVTCAGWAGEVKVTLNVAKNNQRLGSVVLTSVDQRQKDFGAYSFKLVEVEPRMKKEGEVPQYSVTLIASRKDKANVTLVASDLRSFESWDEVVSFLESNQQAGGFGLRSSVLESMTADAAGAPATAPQAGAAKSTALDYYSATNIQVAGVDEADIVKNDGKFIYAISNGKLVILNAFPPSETEILSTLDDGTYTNLFVNGDKIIAFGREKYDWNPIILPLERRFKTTQEIVVEEAAKEVAKAFAPGISILPPFPRQSYASFVKVFDVSDRSNPVLLKTVNSQGNYVESRMIEDKVYVIFSEYAQGGIPRPVYAINGNVRSVEPWEIGYFDYPSSNYQFTTVLGFDLNDLDKTESREIVLMGGGQNIFVSRQNAFVTYTQYDYYDYYSPNWESYNEVLKDFLSKKVIASWLDAIDESDISNWRKDRLKVAQANKFLNSLNESQRNDLIQKIYKKYEENRESRKNYETTAVHKFALGEKIEYLGKGEVPGRVLNQFSLDEFNGFFRIATTISPQWWQEGEQTPSQNNLYVLNSNLEVVGSLENLAPGESIFSARFMGNKAYLVTFKKVDPLFVVGLEDPTNPKLLGKLKIPGFSDYLHPYDENYLIGLGKDAIPAKEGDFAWYQGVKLSLFDVRDVSKPKEVASFVIGDRGTESYALHDHKAFLFSKDRNLLVIPIKLAIVDIDKYPRGVEPQSFGEFKFQGAFVFDISPDGISLNGRVTHAEEEDFEKSGEYYYGYGNDVKRSLYLDEYLYTLSENWVKANNLETLSEEASVKLPGVKREPYYYDDDVVIALPEPIAVVN